MKTGDYDVVSASGDASLRMIAAGTVEPANPDLVPNYKDVYSFLKAIAIKATPEAAFEEGLDFLAPVSVTPRTLPPLLYALATGRPARTPSRGSAR